LPALLQAPAREEGQRARPVNRVQAGIRRRQRAAAAAQQQQQQEQEADAEQETASEVSSPPLIALLPVHAGAAGFTQY